MGLRRQGLGPSPSPSPPPLSVPGLPPELTPADIIIEARSGRVRQAGAAHAEGSTVMQLRAQSQHDLFTFAKFILKRTRLVPHFHGRLCRGLQRIPPRRKVRLVPMGTFKTSIVSQSMPIHMHIQEAADNCYWPGLDGSEMRILLACESEGIASSRLGWVQKQWEENKLLRAFWPHRMWERLSDAPKWNETAMTLRRSQDFPEPSMRAIGVGGAFIGHHYNVIIKDDLIGFEAANSAIVMKNTMDWHIASRTRFSPDEDMGLEFIIGTRWAPGDIYEQMESDPTVDYECYGLVHNGKPLIPELFPLEKIAQLEKAEGAMFYLWRMNSAADPALTDFDLSQLRRFTLREGILTFAEDDRDLALAAKPFQDQSPASGYPIPLREAFPGRYAEGSRDDYFALKLGKVRCT